MSIYTPLAIRTAPQLSEISSGNLGYNLAAEACRYDVSTTYCDASSSEVAAESIDSQEKLIVIILPHKQMKMVKIAVLCFIRMLIGHL